jgi:hypothetical protein
MRFMVPTIVARHAAAVAECDDNIAAAQADGYVRTGGMKYTGVSAATMLWAAILADPTYREQISGWIKLAQISHVSIGGGVQVEQLFSYLTFIKNDLRSCLKPYHLNVCLRIYHTAHHYPDLAKFPYMRAFVKWLAKRTRRAAERTIADA